MSRPRVSVILDNYNYGAFLAQAVDSVLNQTFEEYELILVDDGSEDQSREIIEQYAKKDGRIVPVLKENGGQTSAFNAGFAASSGDIIAFLDSDDYWYPDKLEKVVRRHEEFALVQHYLSFNGKGVYRKVNEHVNWHQVLTEYGYLYNHSVCSSLSFRRELIEPFFPLIDEREMVYCTDGVLWMIGLSLAKVGFLSEVLGFYRVHGKNLYVNHTDAGKKAREVLEKQHFYVNKQLAFRGYPTIAFDKYRYFKSLIGKLMEEKKILLSDRFVVYGTEASGIYMSEVLTDLHISIWGYADSNTAKQGNDFLGGRIYAPEDLTAHEKEFDKIVIASSASEEIMEKLCTLKLSDRSLQLPI